MPVDPFFTSGHKDHFVSRPEVGEYLTRMFALPKEGQQKAFTDLDIRASRGERLNGLEVTFMKRFRFLKAVQTRAVMRWAKAKQRRGRRQVFFRGLNTGPR
jgi:hypothetical protein